MRNKFTERTRTKHINSNYFHSYHFGKDVNYPFVDPHNYTYMVFSILHSDDVWTSPLLRSLGHIYNVFFLVNYLIHFCTFLILNKSQVYS